MQNPTASPHKVHRDANPALRHTVAGAHTVLLLGCSETRLWGASRQAHSGLYAGGSCAVLPSRRMPTVESDSLRGCTPRIRG